MNQIFDPTRTIHIPLSGYVDVTGMEAIIGHPYFARLRFRRQLGFTCMVKPGGLHSRLEHCVGTLHTMRAILRRFQVSADSALYKALETYALLHDVGHGPTSHELEYVLRDDHEEIGRQRVEQMREAVATYADVDLVLALMRGDHEWSVLVKHQTFGADKLDYLERDAYHTGIDIAMNKGKIINCLQFDHGIFGVDEDALEEIITNLSNYYRMYLEVYLHRSVKMFSRMYQRALEESFEQGIIDPRTVWDMVDLELHASLVHHPLIRRITDRQVLTTVTCFKIRGFEDEERYRANSSYSIFAIPEEELANWSALICDAKQVVALERSIEHAAGCPEHTIFLVQPGSLHQLAKLPDIQIFSRQANAFRSLYETSAFSQADALRRIHRAYYLCVMTTPEVQERVRKIDLCTFLNEQIGSQRNLFQSA